MEDTYERLRKKQNLDLPVAYGPEVTYRWPFGGPRHLVFIDDKGIVRAITKGKNLTRETLQALLDGVPSPFGPDFPSIPFDEEKLFLVEGNGGKDTEFLFRSVLAKYNGGLKANSPSALKTELVGDKPTFVALASPLHRLYNYAYIGNSNWYGMDDPLYARVFPHPVLEIKDSTYFKHDWQTKEGLYNYSFSVPLNKYARDKKILCNTCNGT